MSEKDTGFAWTTERPTKSGWYWMQAGKGTNVVKVLEREGVLFVYYIEPASESRVLAALSSGIEWAGPLRPPE